MKTTASLATLQDVQLLLARAVPYEVGGTHSLDALTEGCAVFALKDAAGQTVGAFSLECLTDTAGTVIHVTAAGGVPGHDLVGDMAEFTEAEARGRINARAVRCVTRRRGLVKRLERAGFRVAGYVMQKDIA